MRRNGFTLLELLVAMAIVALVLTLALPHYLGHVDHAKETVLRNDLAVMRRVIDQFHADRGRYPESLEELVTQRYLREIPVDPVTERRDTWRTVSPLAKSKGNVSDVRSGATGIGKDGQPYANW